ncbi:nucleotidyltransferase domain-containing protein [Candidatus Woesearchaeota archaeon]|nr:nucleotidyltransferase domain-containing protein [Candidatus Woesearchaeota archaeon]
MLEKSTNEKILELFFDNPTTQFHLRELSRKLKLSMPTIVSTTDQLAELGLIIKKKGKIMTVVMANRDNVTFIRLKRVNNIKKIYSSSIIDYLTKQYNNPKIIILFGSFSRGEDIEKSDVDIAIITNKNINLDILKYEKFLKKRINIHEIEIKKISQEFQHNLYNGIIMGGYW